MKKNKLFSLYLLIVLASIETSAQIGIGTTTPRAALEINSATNGFLPPRVALTSITVSSPIVNPQTSGAPLAGTIVYNTATDGVTPNNVTPGYYVWNGNVWTKFSTSNTSTDVEDDLRVTIDKGSNSAQLGNLTGISGPEIWFFRDNQGIEAMSFTVQLPHNWKEGSTIYPHIHWIPRASASGNMVWNLDYTWANMTTGTFSAVTTTTVTVNGPFVLNSHIVSDLTPSNSGISGAGKNISSVLICRIWRNSATANDTYAADAGGISMDFHISIVNQFTE
ncbi:hypothetical protein GJU43_20350 [Flavobacterium sp. LC2016-23]|uniref:hypothetical protein n=1 Tax=Flavobacterium sp. LC2016-23 TaxID=2666330 RepID=UPI0012B0E7A9|nr:hypothetical protein [Flavobacterium sp. LC2016-23]MRX41641.1 hypothetical protein [Flavobacterium sp. LC2016-23]